PPRGAGRDRAGSRPRRPPRGWRSGSAGGGCARARRGGGGSRPCPPGRSRGSRRGSVASWRPAERLIAERDQTPADLLEAEGERVRARDRGGQLGEPELLVDPRREVVRVAAREARLVQEAAVGVEVDAVERHLLQLLEQLTLVVGAPAEHLAQLPAAEEVEGGASAALAHASSGATARRAQSAATVAPARTSGGLARHHPSARTCAGPRSSRTPAASASSRRASASAAPRGRSRRRSSSTRSRAEASQAAGSTTPGRRSSSCRLASTPRTSAA